MTDGANTSGAWLTGCIPHRLPGGKKILNNDKGLNTLEMFSSNLKGYILFGTEFLYDSFYGVKSLEAFKKADFILSFTSYKSKFLEEYATILLPIAHTYENTGSFVNVSGIRQSFSSIIPLDINIKKGYNAIIELANYLSLPGFFYKNSSSVLEEIKSYIPEKLICNWNVINVKTIDSSINDGIIIIPNIDQYRSDSMLSRSKSLQNINVATNDFVIYCNTNTYEKIKCKDGYVYINNDGERVKYNVEINEFISNDNILIDYNYVGNFKNFSLPYEVINLYNK